MSRFRPLLLFPLLLSLGATPALAHPHVWVDYHVTAQFSQGRVAALAQEWSFDEDFSASVMTDVLKRKGLRAAASGPFSPGDTARLQQAAFSNLKHYAYFTHVWQGGKPAAVGQEVSGFQASMRDGRLIYHFVLPLAAPVDPHRGEITVGIWDDTYYVDVGPARDSPARLDGDGAAGCKARIADDPAHLLYFGSVTPQSVRISC